MPAKDTVHNICKHTVDKEMSLNIKTVHFNTDHYMQSMLPKKNSLQIYHI